ncbi:MAG: SapC family protein, partial [Alphaproteobacteria bacterium]
MSDQEGIGEQAGATPAGDVGQAPDAPIMPLFYTAPQPINAQRHAKYGVSETADLSFAEDANVVPFGVNEFAAAAKFYPIVFAAEAPHMPVAICGMRSGENAFVTSRKLWAENCYVRAYVRRYPFMFMETPQ